MSVVEVRTTSQKGRGLYATAPIKEGTVMLEEIPLVSAQFLWNYTYGYLACEYCLKPLETAETNVRRLTNDYGISLPYAECCPIQEQLGGHSKCPDCREVYCSDDCLQTAVKLYHGALCLGAEKGNLQHPVNVLVEFWKKMHYPPETSSIQLVIKIIGMFKQSNNITGLRAKFDDFVSQTMNEDLMIFHKMLGENFSQQIDELYELIRRAFVPIP